MNINTLDLNLLLVLDALQRTHSVTRAGEQLCTSQSGVSNALRRLRDAFGDELFVRTESGMMPTPLAESMAGPEQGEEERSTHRAERGFQPRQRVASPAGLFAQGAA